MRELARLDEKVTREEWSRDDAVRYFESIGEKYKAEIIAAIPGRRADRPVSRGQVHRPVPRPARAFHRQAQGLQADEARRRLLARRLQQRDAPAHLRHRLGPQGRPGRLPAHAGGGREARPSQLAQGPRPVPHAGRGAGHGVLASQGLGHLAAGRAVHARGLLGERLPGGALPADPRREPVEALRPLGQLQGEHVLHVIGEARLRGQADELSGTCADLQLQPAQLPRAAAALRRVRRAATATSRPAPCTASCACAPSRRTTATSSAPRSRSNRR